MQVTGLKTITLLFNEEGYTTLSSEETDPQWELIVLWEAHNLSKWIWDKRALISF